MSRTISIRVATLVATLAAWLPACGGVEPLSARDPTLPIETRSWIGGAEDGVIVAQADLEVALTEEREVDEWISTTRDEAELSGALDDAFDELADAREDAASAAVEVAEIGLELALAKRTLVYAEAAVNHDRGVYDLLTLREAVETIRERRREATRDFDTKRQAVEEATNAWWQAYASHVSGGGETTGYWTAGIEVVEQAPPERPRVMEEPQEEGEGEEGEGASTEPTSGSLRGLTSGTSSEGETSEAEGETEADTGDADSDSDSDEADEG